MPSILLQLTCWEDDDNHDDDLFVHDDDDNHDDGGDDHDIHIMCLICSIIKILMLSYLPIQLRTHALSFLVTNKTVVDTVSE